MKVEKEKLFEDIKKTIYELADGVSYEDEFYKQILDRIVVLDKNNVDVYLSILPGKWQFTLSKTLAPILNGSIFDTDNPLVVWGTLSMGEPYVGFEWYVDYVDENADKQIGEIEQWFQNEHCLALVGFDEDNYYFADSMTGQITPYSKESSENSFAKLGSQAIVVE